MLEGKCAKPKDPTPGITTYFCVYDQGHEGDHSWQHTAEERAKRHAARRKPSDGVPPTETRLSDGT